MTTLEWSSDGIGLTSLFCASLLLIIFRKKCFGYLDPLAIYLSARAAPTFASLILLFSTSAISSYFYVLGICSALIFIATLYVTTPKVSKGNILNRDQIDTLLKISIALSIFKFIILFFSSGTLPIFGESGSDSFIGFAEDNKLGTSFLFAIGSSELALISLLIFVTKGRKRLLAAIILLLSILMHLSMGKKSSLLAIILALALGEYLRIEFTNQKERYFTNMKYVSLLFGAALMWAGFVFQKTSGSTELPEGNMISALLDILYIQFAYPTYLFSSGDLLSFFRDYHVNKLIYFLHTALSPLGFPAFETSIGPALNEYETGQLTGNGINPTYLLEGYVLFGALLPVYSFLAALFIGKLRKFILQMSNPRNKVILCSLLLPSIYIFPVDALLFMKIITALLLMSPCLFLLTRITKK